MIRSTLRLVALVVVVGLIGILIGRSTAPRVSPAAMVRQQEIDAGLDRMVPVIDFQQTPIDQAIEFLRDQTHANIIVNWRELEGAGIDNAVPITLHLSNVSLHSAMKQLLEVAGGGTVELGLRNERGVIDVSTTEAMTESRIYDVRDLIQSDVDLRAHIAKAASARGITTLSLPPNSGDPYKDSTDALVNFISTTYGGWDGPRNVEAFGGRLIVVESAPIQNEIAILLDELRENP
jgi:hypothetical protein